MESKDSPVDTAQASGENQQHEDKVAYSSFQKVLNEKKTTQSKLSEVEKELAKYREKEMETQGKTQELIDGYRKRVDELESTLNKTKKTFAWNTVSNTIKAEAAKLGCQDPDKLIRLMDDQDLQALNVDENFNLDRETLSKVLEKNKKENYFLFKESAPKAAMGVPSNEPKKVKKTQEDILNEYVKNIR